MASSGRRPTSAPSGRRPASSRHYKDWLADTDPRRARSRRQATAQSNAAATANKSANTHAQIIDVMAHQEHQAQPQRQRNRTTFAPPSARADARLTQQRQQAPPGSAAAERIANQNANLNASIKAVMLSSVEPDEEHPLHSNTQNLTPRSLRKVREEARTIAEEQQRSSNRRHTNHSSQVSQIRSRAGFTHAHPWTSARTRACARTLSHAFTTKLDRSSQARVANAERATHAQIRGIMEGPPLSARSRYKSRTGRPGTAPMETPFEPSPPSSARGSRVWDAAAGRWRSEAPAPSNAPPGRGGARGVDSGTSRGRAEPGPLDSGRTWESARSDWSTGRLETAHVRIDAERTRLLERLMRIEHLLDARPTHKPSVGKITMARPTTPSPRRVPTMTSY